MSKNIYTTFFVCALLVLAAHAGYSQEAKFLQQNTADGLVVMEAENYSAKVEQSTTSSWDTTTSPAGYSGVSAMQALPADPNFTENKDLNTAQANAPILRFVVNFVKTDPVYVWARTSHVDGFDDSFWLGLNGEIIGTSSNHAMSYLTSEQQFANEWYWIHYLQGGDTAKFDIPSAGVHTFEIYMREQALKLDKIILTTNKDYTPSGVGPAETIITSVNTSAAAITNFELKQNYPNPFNPTTTIKFSIPSATHVSVIIYNALGKEVANLLSKEMSAGEHTTVWNALGLPSGAYFCRVQAGDFIAVKKLLLLK